MSAPQDPSQPPADGTCHLLELPAELRNRIYRLVLLRDRRIRVSSSGFARGCLVSTCKQIRHEALKIYYYENNFFVMRPDWASDNGKKFYAHVQQLGFTYTKTAPSFGYHGGAGVRTSMEAASGFKPPHWPNVLETARRIHSGEIPPPIPIDIERFKKCSLQRPNTGAANIWAMNKTAHQLRHRPWTEVEEILDNQRRALAGHDEGWLQDKD